MGVRRIVEQVVVGGGPSGVYGWRGGAWGAVGDECGLVSTWKGHQEAGLLA